MTTINPYWILKDGKLKQSDLQEWSEWYETFENRIVAKDKIGDTELLTVCFGYEAYPRFDPDEPPVVLGTALTEEGNIRELKQHTSVEEAKRFHASTLRRFRQKEAD